MNTEVFRFKLGDLNCMAVCDGTMKHAPPSFLFANAPKEPLDRFMSQIGQTRETWTDWNSSYNCLLVETAKQRILIDTGADGLEPNTGKLLPNLRREGIAPEDIDVVILTHGHPDHIGGNTNKEGKPVFPKARWVIGKGEFAFWTSDVTEKEFAERGAKIFTDIARKNLLPLGKQLDLIAEETEIVPGIRTIAASGHTPGQIALDISSQGKHLIYISDIVLHPLHLVEPGWYASVDIFPDQTVLTRRKILPKLAAGNTLVMAFHFRFPGLGRIIPKGDVWQWQPVETTV